MRVFNLSTILIFAASHAGARRVMMAWYTEALRALWLSPADIKKGHRSASFLGNDRVVFNIGGNNYRLVVHIRYKYHAVYIRFIGTHEEYNQIDAETV